MSTVDERLDELLDIQGEIVEVEKKLPNLSLKGRSSLVYSSLFFYKELLN